MICHFIEIPAPPVDKSLNYKAISFIGNESHCDVLFSKKLSYENLNSRYTDSPVKAMTLETPPRSG